MASLIPPTNILTTYKSVIILSCKSMWYSFQAEVFNFGRSVQVPIHTGLACPTSQLCPYKLKSNTLWPDGQYLEQKLHPRIKRGRKYISQAADICTPVQMQGGLKGILSKVCRNAQSSQNSLYQSATSNSSFGLRDPLGKIASIRAQHHLWIKYFLLVKGSSQTHDCRFKWFQWFVA